MTRLSIRRSFTVVGATCFSLGLLLGCGPEPGQESGAPEAAGDGHVHEPGQTHDPSEAGTEVEPGAQGAADVADSGDEGEPHVIHLEPGAVEAWGLAVGPVGRTTVSTEIQLPGVMATNGNRTARITSLVVGQVAELLVDLGSRVTPGQTLASLNSPEFTRAQAAFLQAYAQSQLSRTDYERALVLRAERAIEEREFLRRQALYEQHLAEFRTAEVILHSHGVEEAPLLAIMQGLDVDRPVQDHSAVEPLLALRTPIAGVVIQRDAVLGSHVESGHTLFTVSDLSVLWAQLDAYENQLPGLIRNAEVLISTPVFPDRIFPGRVTVISDQVDPDVRTVRVRAEVPNPEGLLRPNMYVQGFLRVRTPGEERLVLPEEAIQLMEGHHVVFVALPSPPGESHLLFEEREVVPGGTLSEGRIILGGLDGTERVVTTGAFTLKAEMTKGAGGHDHAH